MAVLDVLKEFALKTSIHGLTFIAQPKLSTLTRVSWIYIFIAAMVYAGHELKLAVICKSLKKI